jgi:hypothetical protein
VPKHCPHKIQPVMEELLILERVAHPHWGARKLLAVLRRAHPRIRYWPAACTVADLLARRGLVHKRRARRASVHPGAVRPVTVAPKLFGNAHVSYAYGQGAVALAAGYFGRRIADQAYYGGDASNLAPRPEAPVQLETRLTLSGEIPGLPGLEYLAGASYLIASHQPYVVGPNQGQPSYLVPQTLEADLAFVNRLTVFIGLSFHLGADGKTRAGQN